MREEFRQFLSKLFPDRLTSFRKKDIFLKGQKQAASCWIWKVWLIFRWHTHWVTEPHPGNTFTMPFSLETICWVQEEANGFEIQTDRRYSNVWSQGSDQFALCCFQNPHSFISFVIKNSLCYPLGHFYVCQDGCSSLKVFLLVYILSFLSTSELVKYYFALGWSLYFHLNFISHIPDYVDESLIKTYSF